MKIKTVIIGSGNIGTDLMYKALRSEYVEPTWMVGIDPNSEGLARAKSKGLNTSANGLESVIAQLKSDNVQIAFDATSAKAHLAHAKSLGEAGIITVDLTPAGIGPYCIPPVNLEEHIETKEVNVNMVSCGGQATIPIVAAVNQVQNVQYAEIVATVSSKSVGPGTRNNIDEFTRTTAQGIEKVGGAKTGKAIIVINPAEPPIMMRDTIHCLTETEPDKEAIIDSIHAMIREVQHYVPGYQLKNGPVFDGNRITTFLEVAGLGDFLPAYAGNLDIMTAAALRTGEMLVQPMLKKP